MKNKDWIIITLVLIILIIGIGLVSTIQNPINATSNITNLTQPSSNNSGTVQGTPTQKSTDTQNQMTNTEPTTPQTEAQSEYVTLTCEVCGKQFQSPRNGQQLRICDQCVNTPAGQKLLQEAGY